MAECDVPTAELNDGKDMKLVVAAVAVAASSFSPSSAGGRFRAFRSSREIRILRRDFLGSIIFDLRRRWISSMVDDVLFAEIKHARNRFTFEQRCWIAASVAAAILLVRLLFLLLHTIVISGSTAQRPPFRGSCSERCVSWQKAPTILVLCGWRPPRVVPAGKNAASTVACIGSSYRAVLLGAAGRFYVSSRNGLQRASSSQ